MSEHEMDMMHSEDSESEGRIGVPRHLGGKPLALKYSGCGGVIHSTQLILSRLTTRISYNDRLASCSDINFTIVHTYPFLQSFLLMKNNCDAKKCGGKDGVAMIGRITTCQTDKRSAASMAKDPLPQESLQGRLGLSTQGSHHLRVRC